MKAHDVRHLTVCAGTCGDLLDRRKAILAGGNCWCGKCCFAVLGISGIKNLPRAERGKFTIGQVGPKAMMALMEAK